MDDDATTISYGEHGEDHWWATVVEWRTAETFAENHVPGRYKPKIMTDRDPTAQPPHPLPPLEHGPGPLLDASEA